MPHIDHQRRRLVQAALATAAGLPALSCWSRPGSDFERLFALALQDMASVERTKAMREHPHLLMALPPVPRVRSERRIAHEAIRMIVLFEVSSSTLYRVRYQQPVWPGGNSGATIGIGYDLGYSSASWLEEDWHDCLTPQDLERLANVCGKTGQLADKLVKTLHDITVPWPNAYDQFTTRSLPTYVGKTLQALPQAADLSDRSLGALVSLVYNRGPNFDSADPRHAEMRAIKSALAMGQACRIPDLIRRMVRLWTAPDEKGIRLRRLMEAALFQEGLADSGPSATGVAG